MKMLIEEGQTPTMVCSAMGKTTNNLLNAGDFALKDGKVGVLSFPIRYSRRWAGLCCDVGLLGVYLFIYFFLFSCKRINVFASLRARVRSRYRDEHKE